MDDMKVALLYIKPHHACSLGFVVQVGVIVQSLVTERGSPLYKSVIREHV